MDQLSNGFTGGFATLAEDRATTTELKLTGTKAKVLATKPCLGLEDTPDIPCELYPDDKDKKEPPKLFDIEMDSTKTMAALRALRNYAHALEAVTNAADRTAFDSAVAQLAGSVGALAKNAGMVAPGASTIAPVAVNALGWLVGTALDQERFDALKAGVTAAGTPRSEVSHPSVATRPHL